MTWCGCRRCSARTGTGCWRGPSPRHSLTRCCARRASRSCCRRSTSRWTGRCWRRGRARRAFRGRTRRRGLPPEDPGNPTVDFHKEKRTNETHQSTTDPDARLARKGKGKEAKLSYAGHVLMENRNGLVVNVRLTQATGTAEREAAVEMVDDIPGPEAGDGGCRQELRRRSDGAAVAGTEGHAARGAEPGTAAQCHRQPDHTAPGLPDQPESAEEGGKRVSDG